MKKTKWIILLLPLLMLVNCQKEKFGVINGSNDWQFDDSYTQFEKSLFDTLKFYKTAEYVSDWENTGSITDNYKPKIKFSPNPFTDYAILSYNTAPIINIVIVDKTYTKVLETRYENTRSIAFEFSDYKSGNYRLYYVIQDSTYHIVQMGHGNIQKQ